MLMEWFLDRMKEPSTWRGLIGIVTAGGVAVSSEQSAAIIAAGLAFAGLINVFRNENNNNHEK